MNSIPQLAQQIEPGQKNFAQLERLATALFDLQVFANRLEFLGKQTGGPSSFRYDAIYRVKPNVIDDFWTLLRDRFNSPYVVVECKHYQNGIGDKEVILTANKYLFPKALRSVCFMFCFTTPKTKAVRVAEEFLRS
jgi:hypothetical protein